jgi:acetate kinase
MNVLVLNCGSSTIKFQIIATDLEEIANNTDRHLARGQIDRVGGEALINIQAERKEAIRTTAPMRDVRAAVDYILRWSCSETSGIEEVTSAADIHAVGHRVVHGGERFTHSALITQEVIKDIEDCIELAPLHNPANLKGIAAAKEIFGHGIPQVAVFDTAFHQTLQPHAYLYALPYQLYRRHRVRRYGFHGTSHRYVAYRFRQIRGIEREKVNVITLHLGNGCSACVIKNGNSYDTSMGLTPLEGLVMGTRSGDVDAAILDYLSHKEGLTMQEIQSVLNKQSGLLGISGLTNDMRELLAEAEENDDRRARLAIEIFCFRVKKYIGAYLAATGGTDALIFTGGIGENSAEIRRKICDGLEWFGLKLDEEKNQSTKHGKEEMISTDDSRFAAYAIPTDEELLIARDTVRCVRGVQQRY